MNKKYTPFEALEKIDHTICLNINERTLKFGIDDFKQGPNGGPIDCADFDEFCECYEVIRKTIVEYNKLKADCEKIEKILANVK